MGVPRRGRGTRSSTHIPSQGAHPSPTLTMLARARRVDCTCVWLVFSNRSLASKISWGFTPYLVMALMKLPMFSSWTGAGSGQGCGGVGGAGWRWAGLQVEVGGATGQRVKRLKS